MGNFKTHNTPVFDYKLTNEDYWDFHLALDSFSVLELNDQCLSAYIDITDVECIDGVNLLSKSNYTWEQAYNDGVTFQNIGLTGVDNGLFTYDKDHITNKEFLDIFTNSSLTFEPADYRLHLNRIEGNNKIYSYDAEITEEGAKLNGGFFQGFFKDASNQYQVLPHILENGWQIEVTLKKEDFERTNPIMRLNDHYPDNKGIFFFIGARAENKWWNYYNVEENFDESETNYLNLEILPFEPVKAEPTIPYLNIEYLGNNYNGADNKYSVASLFDVGYKVYEFKGDPNDKNVLLNYIATDEPIDKTTITTKNGLNINTNDEVFIDTDNKFLLFDQTKNGYTTCTWGETEENTQFTIQMEKKPETDNYFLLFNQTENGYTTCNIDDYLSSVKDKYDINADLYNNALAFIINDEGKIGYRCTIKDCESDDISTTTEFSKYPLIKDNEWHTISIRIKPSETEWVTKYDCPNLRSKKGLTMKFFIYVDGYLKMVSQDVPIIDLRALNTQAEKQEGVPFNISLGGGTQGLCDSVSLDYKTPPKNVLFTEKNYAGSFIGWIKDFKFYSCPQNLTALRNNLNIILK